MITLFDTVHIMAYAVAAMLITTFFVLYHIGLIYYREQDATRQGQAKNAQLATVMRTCNIRIWMMNPRTERYVLLSESGTVEAEYMPIDFSNLYKHADFDVMRRLVHDIRDCKRKEATCRVKSKRMDDGQRHTYEVTLRVLDSDMLGRPTAIIGLQHDITDILEKQSNVNRLLMLYHTIFDSSIIDTMYYDKDGILRDINQKACETFGIRDRKALLDRGPRLKDVPAYCDLDVEHFEGYRMSTITNIDKIRQTKGSLIPEITINGTIYYDTIANPIYDEQGKMTGIYTAGRPINEVVESFRRQKEGTKRLQQATHHIEEYIENINLALRVSEVRLMNYTPETHEFEISNDLNNAQVRLTQLRAIQLVDYEYRAAVSKFIRKMDRRENTRIDVSLRTLLRDHQQRPVWLTFNIIPMLRKDGTVSHYFGMCRNETEMVATGEKLKKESQKAQETELLKDAFLQNMSYELRTPLSAVLGFAELLSGEHSAEEELVFIDLIKQNSNQLLQLVNDSLFISRLDAHMVEIKRQTTDFAMLFEGWCQLGWADRADGVSTTVENPYEHLLVDIDDANMALVVQKLCQACAIETREGWLRARYEYRRDALIITFEDTSDGFGTEMVKHLFERFVQDANGHYIGSGLMLPIAKELIDQMGGTIDVQSEEGKGTTAWVTIPCTASQIVKRDFTNA